MSNLIIVAAGEGTRLLPYTEHLPKLLIEVDGKVALDHILAAWQYNVGSPRTAYNEGVDRILIICNSKHLSLLSHYCALYHWDRDIIFRTHDYIDGNARALTEGTRGLIALQYNTYVTWSDLWPTSKISGPKWDEPVIVFTSDRTDCRYATDDQGRPTKGAGGVVGIYWLESLCSLATPKVGEDLADLIARSHELCHLEKCSVRDFGDLKKLHTATNTQQSRYFNTLTFETHRVTKRPTDERGKDLLQRETHWYQNVGPKPYLPTFSNSEGELRLERLDAVPLHTCYEEKHLLSLLDVLEDLHSSSTTPPNQRGMAQEYIYNTYARVREVHTLLPTYDRDSLQDLLIQAENYLRDNPPLDRRWTVIHGDCQFSNTLVGNQGQIYLIDPRGYFGDSLVYGPPEYDYVKVAYALSGYDAFNLDTEFSGQIPTPKPVPKVLRDLVGPRLDVLVALTWIKLTPYLRNNLLKMWAAYDHGLQLLQQALYPKDNTQ